MMNGAIGAAKSNSLMSEYSAMLGDAVLRHRARIAEHSARIEAELASRVKSEFIANMSHELRTPLNTMIGFSKLMAQHETRQLKDAEIIEYSGLIQDAATHLLAIINDILDISKIQAGKYTLASREVDLDEVLLSLVASFKLTAQDAGVSIETHIAADLPIVRGDAVKLRQIFMNLVSNAIKFTQSGGSVALEAHRLPSGGAAFLVRDTGIGMSAEEIEVAMTPFGQVDGGKTRWREGTGLGLPIAKALVELHGGTLKLQSTKGVGTEVRVVLPPSNAVNVAVQPNVMPAKLR